MMPAPLPSFSTLLLAGGRSVRMGRDKAMLDWQGRPLWQEQLEKLAFLCPSALYVACREEQGLHQQVGAQAVTRWFFDPPGEEQGPMGAILRVLREQPGLLLVMAVDMPQMQPAWLLEQLAPSALAGRGCFFQTRQGIEPLCALFAPAMLPWLEQHVAARRLALRPMAEAMVLSGMADRLEVAAEDEAFFHNMNTPGDYEAAV